MATSPISIGRWSVMLCIVGIGLAGCNRPGAPGCLMRAGDWIEIQEVDIASPEALKLHNHMNVVMETWDSAAMELVWSGPENVLANRWVEWDGTTLELGYEDRCQWMRDLDANVGLIIKTPGITHIALHGQGWFHASLLDSSSAVSIDAHAYAGYIELDCELDSLTVRLHAGASSATAEGDVGTLLLFASGLSGVDASAVLADRAFINQSAHPPLRFRALEYAYIELNSHSNVVGRLPKPLDYQVVRNGSGELLWED